MKKRTIVKLQDVFFSYDEAPVLENVSFEIKEQDFLGIIGPNGGGKSTLLKLILGLLKPDSGTIKVFDTSPKKGRKSIGYMPQIFKSDFDFPISVMEVTLMGRLGKKSLGRKYSQEDIDICLDVLEKVDMKDYKDRQINNLSGGQRQRIFIARALATEPKLLLLDEPVSSIDQKWQQSFYELLHKLSEKLAIVLVSHDIGVISTYIDKIACVSGSIYYHGSTKDGLSKISEMYQCPIELLVHGVPHSSIPHRLLESRKDD
ncbi:ATP-binding cassette domain-containing protein [Candidatus Poribacteria bacterium]|nr:ATP-binding cassette domain-containing protein [Candidatus Poribacteria bacterium]